MGFINDSEQDGGGGRVAAIGETEGHAAGSPVIRPADGLVPKRTQNRTVTLQKDQILFINRTRHLFYESEAVFGDSSH